MSSDTPTASWHPAFMPNTLPSSKLKEPRFEPPSSPKQTQDIEGDVGTTRNASWHPAFMPNTSPNPRQEEQGVESRLSEGEVAATKEVDPVTTAEPVANFASGPDAWFAQEDGDGWLEEGPPQEVVSQQEAPAAAANLNPQHDIEEPDAPSIPETKQARPISFARTVSHEVHWTDDDDAEWTLPRSDTDPFKFMPPSNRSNSFPAVPPQPTHETHELDHLLPSSQTEELLHEIEQETEHHDEAAEDRHDRDVDHPDSFWGDENLEGGPESQQYLGGDLMGSGEEATAERYTEGLPLIPNGATNKTPKGEDDSAAQTRNPFSDFGDGEEDFFNQVREAHSDDHRPPAVLERKSTLQVLNGLAVGGGISNDTIQEETEEEEEKEVPEFAPPHDQDVTTQDTKDSQGPGASQNSRKEGTEDLDSKWEAAFAGDDADDFLLEDTETKEVDPAAFFGSDDEGFLDDTEEPAPGSTPPSQPSTLPTAITESKRSNGRYLPPNLPTLVERQPSSPYYPSTITTPVEPLVPSPFGASAVQPPVLSPFVPSVSVSTTAPGYGYGAPPPRPEPNKAQSFADKSKGGYTSPYDLPMEVVKPKKRMSMQNLQRTVEPPTGPPVAPPSARSASMYSQPPLKQASRTSLSPPTSSHSTQPPPLNHKLSLQAVRSKESFFEDLPVVTKPRPGSRQSNKSLPSPSQLSPNVPPTPPQAAQYQMSPRVNPTPQIQYQPSHSAAIEAARLVAPERVSPYAPLQSGPAIIPSAPSAPSSRYSPAPASMLPPQAVTASTRYSPAPGPAARSPGIGYAPVPASASAPPSLPPPMSAPVPPPALPHQPRTSSPLAHFEMSHERGKPGAHTVENVHADRRSSSSMYEPRLNRIPSLPPTREVEEDENAPPNSSAPPRGDYRHGHLHRQRQTPPPLAPPTYSMLSPPKRGTSNYTPSPSSSTGHEFVPPPRSHTQSPGALYGSRGGSKATDPIPRPSSVHSPTSPRSSAAVPAIASPPGPAVAFTPSRPRGLSQNLNLVAPTDGRELDPLQRWKGAPLLSWGVGGTIVTSFPKNVPRYGINQTVPMVVRSPGEVKVKNIRDIQPLEERLAKFPGPLKGKSKKKETIMWLTAGIDALEKSLPNLAFQQYVSQGDKRAVERVLLWKILRLFVEFDGNLEANPTVDKAVREVLSPGLDNGNPMSPTHASGANVADLQGSAPAQLQSDAVDASAIERIRTHLLAGDREKAVWTAADKRLWGHAMLIANTVSPELYRQVTHEFVKKEVNYPGHNNESLAALYEVLAGNHEECVDELVPVHARAGLQLMGTSSTTGSSTDALAGLDKWRETLGLVLSNRSTDDTRALNSLGNLLSGYGRAEAAHVCFIFARNHSVFGGLDDPQSNFVLVGSDHRQQPEQFAKEIEPLLLSEVYEYGLSLAGGSNIAPNSPHLAAYKLQHAMALAEYGYRDKALQYCEIISNAITAQTRRSPYHHSVLETAVDDLMKRLKLAPKEESNSWISKPSMNKVSDSMWNRFNKFVAGDDNEGSGTGTPAEGAESGPFAHVTSGTPTISRPPSASNADMFSPNMPGYPVMNGPVTVPPPMAAAPPTTRAASRYAPVSSQSPAAHNPYEPSSGYSPMSASAMERTPSERSRRSFEVKHQPSDLQSSHVNNYLPSNNVAAPPAQSYSPYHDSGIGLSRESSYAPVSQPESVPPVETRPPQSGPTSRYAPAGQTDGRGSSPYEPQPLTREDSIPSTGSYNVGEPEQRALSYGYEPPSMATYEPPAAEPATEDVAPNQEAQESQSSGYEPPSYQPYSYDPPSYNPDPELSQDGGDSQSEPKTKKKSFMDNDDDDIPVAKSQEKTKAEKDRENEEMFRKAAEEDAKRAAAEKASAKKGWGFTGWFGGGGSGGGGGGKKDGLDASAPNKPIRANLGEASSFVYDPEQKRWVNKKAGADDTSGSAKKATPPPPRSAGPPRSASSTPAPPMATPGAGPPPPRGGLTASVSMMGLRQAAAASAAAAEGGGGGGPGFGPPAMMRSASSASAGAAAVSTPPSRPATSMSDASSIDDLLSGAGPRKGGAKKGRKAGRYVDVMAK